MNLPEPIVEVRDLTKRYGRHLTAVDRVSMTVRRGEVYGFLGPNGAGKTTALRMLLGLIAPSGGDIRVLGHRPGTPGSLTRIGSLIEGPTFYPYLSGRHNLRVVARYAGVRSDEIADRVDSVLRVVDLLDRGDDKFSTYSLGMKQRLGVAAALLKDPELIVLDEPTNGLDPAGMRDMRGLIRDLGTSGHTVLLSSHLLGEVQQICDRVAVINRGQIVTEGTVDELRGAAELIVEAAPSDTARQRLEAMAEVERVIAYEGKLRVQVDERHTALVNRTLVDAGVAVTELRRAERELEDVFFEITDQAHEPLPELNHA